MFGRWHPERFRGRTRRPSSFPAFRHRRGGSVLFGSIENENITVSKQILPVRHPMQCDAIEILVVSYICDSKLQWKLRKRSFRSGLGFPCVVRSSFHRSLSIDGVGCPYGVFVVTDIEIHDDCLVLKNCCYEITVFDIAVAFEGYVFVSSRRYYWVQIKVVVSALAEGHPSLRQGLNSPLIFEFVK